MAFALIVLGAADPLEGSVVIAIGAALAAFIAVSVGSRHRQLVLWAAVLVAIGVAAMFAISATGGFGGRSGRSTWWALLLVPYPVGWMMTLVGTLKLAFEVQRHRSRPDAP